MLKRYKIYNESDEDEEYKVCIEHPTDELHTLCGARVSDTLDGQPEETKDLINCEFCIQTIKAIIEGVCPGCFIGPPDCQCWNDK